MKYVRCWNDVRFLAPDGYGPFTHKSAQYISDILALGVSSVSLEVHGSNKKPPTVLIPQKSGLLAFNAQCLRGFGDFGFDQVFAAKLFCGGSNFGTYHFCKPEFSPRNAPDWVDFSGSEFGVVKNISMRNTRGPNIVTDHVEFENGIDFVETAKSLSHFVSIFPKHLCAVFDEYPIAFTFGQGIYLRGDVLNQESKAFCLGVEASRMSCTVS